MKFGTQVDTADAEGYRLRVALEEGIVTLRTAFVRIEVELSVLDAALDKLRAGSGSTPGMGPSDLLNGLEQRECGGVVS